ncbi:MAG: VTT domain-containing protein [Candidatus Rokubacteria bacterium]|nr:VTT domain-containing protein [Candidatus Rokubacteria bacterium]
MLMSGDVITEGDGARRALLRGTLQSLTGVAVIVVLLAVTGMLLRRYVNVEALRGFVQGLGPLAPLAAIALIAVRSLLFLPVLPLPVAATIMAVMFGTLPSALYLLLGMTAGAVLGFVLARFCFGRLIARLAGGRVKRLDALLGAHGLVAVLGLRLLLVSNVPLNLASGLTSIALSDYTLGTVVGLAPTIVIMAYLSATMQEADVWQALLTYPTPLLVPLLLACKVAGAALLALLAHRMRRAPAS